MTTRTTTRALLPDEWPGTHVWGDEERRALLRVSDARSPFRYYGPNPQGFATAFENAVAKRLGRSHALAVNSGTAALSLAMSALRIGPGDEVLVPGYLWPSCVSAVVLAGGVPKLVDIDASFNIDADDMRRKIGPNTRAVLVVHMSGSSARLDEVLRVARDHGLSVVEDVAQANGGTYHGRPLGSFGDLAIFSFQLNKTITAGEGGLLASDDTALFERAAAAHDIGFLRNEAGRLETDDPRVLAWGQGRRMSELAAAVLYEQEAKLERIVGAMRAANQRLYAGLATVPGATPRTRWDADGDNGSFVIVSWPTSAHARAIVERTRALGVRSARSPVNNIAMSDWGLHLYYNNLNLVRRTPTDDRGHPWRHPLNAFGEDYAYDRGTLPTADDLFARSSILAVAPSLTTDAADQIVDCFHAAAQDLA